MSRFNNTLLSSLVAISASDVSNSGASTLAATAGISTTNTVSATALHTTFKTSQKNYCKMTNDKLNLSKNLTEARSILRDSNIVCFDVDSTIITEEGIDELALFCGKGPEVSALTKEAMGGSMTFQDALKRRLDIIKPSQKQIREFIKSHPCTISSSVKEIISKLRSNNADIYLVSGGFDCLIEPVADLLDIPLTNLFANKLFFQFNGSYAGFDVNQVTSKSGGKGEAIKMIKQKYNNNNLKVTMIGDGATDLEASPPADHFIGYGGNVVRAEVRERADYYVTNFADLLW